MANEARRRAARLMGVSVKDVGRAERIRRDASPEVVEAVKLGTMTITEAEARMATKRTKGTKDASRELFRGRGSDAVAAVTGGATAPRKRGPAPRDVQYTRALYRFREDQLEALRTAALERARRLGSASVDISAILRALVDEWIKTGAKPPHEG